MNKKHVIWALLAVTSVFFVPSLVSAKDVNNFKIAEYSIDYYLHKDAEGRSQLKTTERIAAEFPQTDQNHGIERALPHVYDGHPTSLKVESIVSNNGAKVPYEELKDGDLTTLRIGDGDKYVHGRQTYVITYTQRDVMKQFTGTGADEFYWDTNGTGWKVPIEKLAVHLQIEEALRDSLTGSTACYQGVADSSGRCNLNGENGQYRVTATNLAAGENVTLAVGFEPGTFSEYKQSFAEKAFQTWLWVQAGLLVVTIGVLTWLSIRYYAWSERSSELGTIIPEYLPPKNASMQVAAVVEQSPYAFSAQLIDFAVRHYIKIYQTKEKKTFTAAEYEIEIVKDIHDLRPEEKEILADIFSHKPDVGERFELKKLQSDWKLHGRLSDNPKKLTTLLRDEYGIRQLAPEQSRWFKRAAVMLCIVGAVLLSPPLLLGALIVYVLSAMLWPITDEGLVLRRYLKGLRMYIEVAEEERLKILQSPDGAAKTGIAAGTPDEKQLVKLYERVLPYAILFGQEKEWNKHLGRYYESAGTQPDWIVMPYGAAFNAAAFTSSMSSFSTSLATSSSTGGSSGGGSSGGGGGGGGGGGW